MDESFINLSIENIEAEHLCCAISDKKHQDGVAAKKQWLSERIREGHVFRKLDAKGKVFIEYAPLESAWVPVQGKDYLYIYCLWVAGSFSGKGYGSALLEYCIRDAKAQGKAGVCILTSKKKQPFLSDKKFLQKCGFEVVDRAGDGYELMALSFHGEPPRFSESARQMKIHNKELTIYYGMQCPYISDCIKQVRQYCNQNSIPVNLVAVDTLEKAKNLPCIFSNWAVFRDGVFITNHLLNETYMKKKLGL